MAVMFETEEEKRRKAIGATGLPGGGNVVNPVEPPPGGQQWTQDKINADEARMELERQAERRYRASNNYQSPTPQQDTPVQTSQGQGFAPPPTPSPSQPITPAPQYGTQSAADQLRRQQAWSAVQGGMNNPSAYTPEQILMMQNRVANTMASQNTNAERMAQSQAVNTGVAGSGASDRRMQELAAMNQANASGAMTDIEMKIAQDTANRRFGYAQLGADTAGQYGRDELSGRTLEEQALMDRMRLGESGRQFDSGLAADMYRYTDERDILDRYRTQEREDYMPILDEIVGKKKKADTPYGISLGGGR